MRLPNILFVLASVLTLRQSIWDSQDFWQCHPRCDWKAGPGSNFIWSGPNATVTYSFGQMTAGYPTLLFKDATCSGQPCSKVELPGFNCSSPCQGLGVAFSESLQGVGYASDLSVLYSHVDGTLYIPMVKGTYSIPNQWARGSFRYLTLSLGPTTSPDTRVKFQLLHVYFTAQPNTPQLDDYSGYFHSSDDLLNRIWYAGAYTVQLSTVSANSSIQRSYLGQASGWANNAQANVLGPNEVMLTDGAKRDRNGWAGDLAVATNVALVSNNKDNLASVRNALKTCFVLQDAITGSFPYAGSPFRDFFLSVGAALALKPPFTQHLIPFHSIEDTPIYLSSTMNTRFPNMSRGFPHGSSALGLAIIRSTRDLPINAPHEIQELFAKLENLYLEIETVDSDRRYIASSDPVDGAHANKNRARDERLSKLYGLELQLSLRQEQIALQVEKENVDVALASVLAEVQRLRLYNQIGDYIAVLNQELKQDDRMHEFAFKEHKFVTELMEKVREEENGIKYSDSGYQPLTPVRDSLVAAYKFLTKIYTNAEQLIDFLDLYAKRNHQCHNGIKKMYDERNFGAMHNQLVKDRLAIDTYGFGLEDRTRFLACIECVQKTFFRHFTWKVDSDFQLTARGEILRKDVTFDKDGNVVIGKPTMSEPLSSQEERKQRAERRAREKAIRDAVKSELIHNIKVDFEIAQSIINSLQEAVAASDICDAKKESQSQELQKLKKLLSNLEQQNMDLQYKYDLVEKDNAEWAGKYGSLRKAHEKTKTDLEWETKRREVAEDKLLENEGLSGLDIGDDI
ncbi:glycoside hydrolase family 78 protein [Cadophora sp. DSE1049]|nr:glycoside hydrolase family 78 protein [Cadophora sp. DSE1049]